MRVLSSKYRWALLLLASGLGWPCGPSFAAASDPAAARKAMVARLRARGIRDQAVLEAMSKVPRHEFVAGAAKAHAYEETELPIGFGQMMPSPYVVATMTEQLRLRPGMKVLEIGTGSGYHAAALSEIARQVYSVEIRPELATAASKRLKELKYTGITIKVGDGSKGLPEHAPFDAILITCASDCVPWDLVHQLRDGGRLVVPVGEGPAQTLNCLWKQGKFTRVEATIMVRVSSRLVRPEEP